MQMGPQISMQLYLLQVDSDNKRTLHVKVLELKTSQFRNNVTQDFLNLMSLSANKKASVQTPLEDNYKLSSNQMMIHIYRVAQK